VRRSDRWAAPVAVIVIGAALLAGSGAPARGADRLRDVDESIQDEQDRVAYLSGQSERIAAEITHLQDSLIEAAAEVQAREDELAGLEKTLAALETSEREKTAALAARQGDMAVLLAALQRMSIEPREALILGWRTPMDTVLAAQLLQFAVPPIEAKAQRLRRELDEIAQLRLQTQRQRERIAAATESIEAARQSIKQLVDLKAGLKQTTEADREAAADRVRALTQQADDLRELLAALPPPPPVAAPPAAEPPAVATLRLEKPKDLKPFPPKQAGLTPPARGVLVLGFGDTAPDGSASQGILIESLPGAQVVAPHDGQVVFRGPFRGYGEILIMEHRGGYHTLLAGLGRTDVVVGQWLRTGEPVGVMDSPREGKPRLYLELRRSGRPIDPWPWFEAHISKVE
jgi:murein hydrolase activator